MFSVYTFLTFLGLVRFFFCAHAHPLSNRSFANNVLSTLDGNSTLASSDIGNSNVTVSKPSSIHVDGRLYIELYATRGPYISGQDMLATLSEVRRQARRNPAQLSTGGVLSIKAPGSSISFDYLGSAKLGDRISWGQMGRISQILTEIYPDLEASGPWVGAIPQLEISVKDTLLGLPGTIWISKAQLQTELVA